MPLCMTALTSRPHTPLGRQLHHEKAGTRRRRASRRGFTIIELLVVLVVVSLMMMIAMRPLNRSRLVTNARSARVEAAQGLALARSAAVARGCRSVFHMTRGAIGPMWVTSCRGNTVGAAGAAVDTLGRMDSLSKRFGVTVSGTADSVEYDARGLSVGFTTAAFAFQSGTGVRDSLTVTALGRVAQ